MTDIVEEARKYIPCSAENVLMNKLADEIERLREANARLARDLAMMMVDHG